jgi:DNA-directed RNA polymerase subunit M/transcription elongation factor TFIIS
MRIETQPYSRVQTLPTLIPESRFLKCPHCMNGVVKQVVDGKDLLWVCIMCGWDKPIREPEHKRYREVEVMYGKRY